MTTVTPAPPSASLRRGRQAGVQGPAPRRAERPAWIPAFAGMTKGESGNDEGGTRPSPPAPLPSLAPFPAPASLFPVTPAEAGVQGPAPQRAERPVWIP